MADRTSILHAARNGMPVVVTTHSLPSETEIELEQILAVFLAELGQEGLYDHLSYCLRELTGNLIQLKESSDASKSKVLVTIYAAESSKYQRVIDVLDALSRARLEDVTFQAGSPEE